MLLLIPNYSLAKESILILNGWVLLGFVLNYSVLKRDHGSSYGRSSIVWVALVALSL